MRARFSALAAGSRFFDGPGGTQVPDSVIDAVATYFRESNANVGGPYGTSIRTEALIDAGARDRRRASSAARPTRSIVRREHDDAQLRAHAHRGRTLRAGDEILVTGLDHDANVSPWLELAHDLGLVVRFVDINDDTTLDLDDLERQLTERTKVVAFPLAANAVGTLTDARRIVELAHEAGALAWADAVHYGAARADRRRGARRRRAHLLAVQVLRPAPRPRVRARASCSSSWRPYKVRPAPNDPLGHRFETGTLPHELLAGFVAAVEYIESIGWDAIQAHERALGERSSTACPDASRSTACRRWTAASRRSPSRRRRTPREIAERLGERGIAVWHGNYYARRGDGAARPRRRTAPSAPGFVHYNTAAEVDRLLEALAEL